MRIIKYISDSIKEFTRFDLARKIIIICIFFTSIFIISIVASSLKKFFTQKVVTPAEKVVIDSLNYNKIENEIKLFENNPDSSAIRDSIRSANGIKIIGNR